jgi:hypothetical protein
VPHETATPSSNRLLAYTISKSAAPTAMRGGYVEQESALSKLELQRTIRGATAGMEFNPAGLDLAWPNGVSEFSDVAPIHAAAGHGTQL